MREYQPVLAFRAFSSPSRICVTVENCSTQSISRLQLRIELPHERIEKDGRVANLSIEPGGLRKESFARLQGGNAECELSVQEIEYFAGGQLAYLDDVYLEAEVEDEASNEINGPGQVFISYARKDIELALRLKTLLEGRNIKVWWDEEGLAGDPDFAEEIARQIARSQVVVVLLSEAALKSDFVKDEMNEGRDKLLILLCSGFAPSQIPFRYRRFDAPRFEDENVFWRALSKRGYKVTA